MSQIDFDRRTYFVQLLECLELWSTLPELQDFDSSFLTIPLNIPSRKEVTQDIARMFPGKDQRLLHSGSRGFVVAIPSEKVVVKSRFHTLPSSEDTLSTIRSSVYAIGYEFEMTRQLHLAASSFDLPFLVPEPLEQRVLLSKMKGHAKVYSCYSLIPGIPLQKLMARRAIATCPSHWHEQRFAFDTLYTSFIRSQGLLDPDRKLDRILVQDDGTCGYVDLEFIMTPQQFVQSAQGGMGCGTPRFIAPERISGDHATILASEIFSHALVYVYGTTGKHPFHHYVGDKSLDIQEKYAHGPYDDVLQLFSSCVPEDISEVCVSSLAHCPYDRPTLEEFVAVARNYGSVPEFFQKIL